MNRGIQSTLAPAGQEVILTAASWRHIVNRHPEMAQYRDAVIEVISNPDAVLEDPRPGRQRFYREGLGPSRLLRVIVDFNQRPALIVTAHGYRKELPSDPSGSVHIR